MADVATDDAATDDAADQKFVESLVEALARHEAAEESRYEMEPAEEESLEVSDPDEATEDEDQVFQEAITDIEDLAEVAAPVVFDADHVGHDKVISKRQQVAKA